MNARLIGAASAGLVLGVAAAGWSMVRLYRTRIQLGRAIATRAIAAQADPGSPCATVLVLGDSTGVGVGAADPAESVAGRIAAAFPRVRIVNHAVSGAQVRDVLTQLDLSDVQRADVVLIQAGANDVLGKDPVPVVAADLAEAVRRAKAMGALVILMPGCNFSHAPFFRPLFAPPPMARRAMRLHAMIHEVARREGATYVDLFHIPRSHAFFREGRRYFCADGLHPSGLGYAVWFEELLRRTPLAQLLSRRIDQTRAGM